jgi:hypothetical protein
MDPREAITIPIIIACFMTALSWVTWAITSNIRRTKVARMRTELQSKVLESLSGSPALMEYLKTDAGQRLADSEVPVQSDPWQRILRSLQGGVIVLIAGLALLWLRNHVGEAALACLIFGTLAVALGLGFLISGALSFSLSKRWGLLERRTNLQSR